jgi:hypothetical protein
VSGAIVFLVLVTVLAAAVGRHLYGQRESRAGACTPLEVLSALRWELPGGTLDGTRFTGRYKDRAIAVSIMGSHYEVELEGIPSGIDLEAKDALTRLEESPETANRSDWQAIVRVFHSHSIRFANGRLVARTEFGGGVIGPHEEAIRLRRLLDKLVEVTEVARLALSLRSRGSAETRCPYCHDDFVGRAQTTECPKCGALHHVDCFTEHGKCAVFACSTRAPQALRDLSGPEKGREGSIV